MNSAATSVFDRYRLDKSASPTASTALHVAVVGAGLAGAACARALVDGGARVTVVEKSRGPGGRLSTRRVEPDLPAGLAAALAFDHGAPGIAARDLGFVSWLARGEAEGWAARWTPHRSGPGAGAHAAEVWLGLPGMPALAQALLRDLPLARGRAVDRLLRLPDGWRLAAGSEVLVEHADQVVIAVPAPQAAALLGDCRPGWTEALEQRPMHPCWTLLGATDALAIQAPCDWDAWHDEQPGQAIVQALRQDRRPGRTAPSGLSLWVAHAGADWSRERLEAPATVVETEMAAALEAVVGLPLRWRHRAAHRWRYARTGGRRVTGSPRAGRADAWHDGRQGLGLCGDAIAGGDAEAAWRSGRTLAAMLLAAESGRLVADVRAPAANALGAAR